MRVALVIGNYINVVDGVALTFRRLVRARTRAGDQLITLAPGAKRPRLDPVGNFVPLVAVPIPVQPEYRFALGIPKIARQKLEQFEPEVIHLGSPDLSGHAALEFASAHGVPVVASYHSDIARYLRYLPLPGFLSGMVGPSLEWAVWQWVRRFYERCGRVLAPSESMLEVLKARGIESELGVWGRGVDAERFSPVHRASGWRRDHGLGERECVVLFAARLRWEKGLDTLAATLGILEQMGVAHRSVVVGDGPARAQLEARCPRTQFLGELRGPALSRAYASSDLFLYPSTTETFGNVTLEAMASGLPTICADATGSRSLVVRDETGLLVPNDDPQAFAEACAALIRDPERRAAMGAAARSRAEAMSWGQAMDSCAAHWNEVVARATHRPSWASP